MASSAWRLIKIYLLSVLKFSANSLWKIWERQANYIYSIFSNDTEMKEKKREKTKYINKMLEDVIGATNRLLRGLLARQAAQPLDTNWWISRGKRRATMDWTKETKRERECKWKWSFRAKVEAQTILLSNSIVSNFTRQSQISSFLFVCTNYLHHIFHQRYIQYFIFFIYLFYCYFISY